MRDHKFENFIAWFFVIVLVNFILRLIVYYNTNLFYFGDFKAHLNVLEKIANGGAPPLNAGNFLFAISYIGYFFKYILGNMDYFFWFNSLLGTSASVIISLLVFYITSNKMASFLTLLILTLYTEFIVFSSVFYTTVIMIFLLAVLVYILYKYYSSSKSSYALIFAVIAASIISSSYFFKQELLFLPIFFLVSSLLLRKDRLFLKKTVILSAVLSTATIIFYTSGILTKKDNDILANDFIFFGHTDYGGDLGEGAFIYPENKARYDAALGQYCIDNNIKAISRTDINKFQEKEIIRFISHHPFRWVEVQATKFFRTYGVVPEGISFKILYTGLFRGNLWLTAIVTVAPVAIIILLFIIFFNLSSLGKLVISTDNPESGIKTPLTGYRLPISNNRRHYIYIHCTLFIYYLIATTFFGHYQERYRIPVMVVFIVPVLSYFLSSFDKKQFLNRTSLITKSIIIVFFLTVWIFQARRALSNEERLNNAIESAEKIKALSLFDNNQNE